MWTDAVEVADVCNKEANQHSSPYLQVVGCAQDEGFVDSEEEVEVSELSEDDLCSDWNEGRGCGGTICKFKIDGWFEDCVESAEDGR